MVMSGKTIHNHFGMVVPGEKTTHDHTKKMAYE
jgi:hypothetical protein